MNDIKDLVIKQIRFSYIKDFIDICKQIEEIKYKDANEYDKCLYEWEQIKRLWNEIDKM
jgi:hypothetical protein